MPGAAAGRCACRAARGGGRGVRGPGAGGARTGDAEDGAEGEGVRVREDAGEDGDCVAQGRCAEGGEVEEEGAW
jgi:hypothetical protein